MERKNGLCLVINLVGFSQSRDLNCKVVTKPGFARNRFHGSKVPVPVPDCQPITEVVKTLFSW